MKCVRKDSAGVHKAPHSTKLRGEKWKEVDQEAGGEQVHRLELEEKQSNAGFSGDRQAVTGTQPQSWMETKEISGIMGWE